MSRKVRDNFKAGASYASVSTRALSLPCRQSGGVCSALPGLDLIGFLRHGGRMPHDVDSSFRLYEQPEFRAASGLTLRPGGEAMTRRGLALCGLTLRPDGAADLEALDIGCGAGATALWLASQGVRVTGIDPSSDLLSEAARGAAALPASAPPPRFVSGRAERLPLDDSSQDLAVCECVLSLTTDPDSAVAETARVLRPDGAFLVADVYERGGGFARRASCGGGSCLAGAMSAPALRALLERHGFAVLAEEDHSRALAELSARLVFGGGSLSGRRRRFRGGCELRYKKNGKHAKSGKKRCPCKDEGDSAL